MRSQPFSPSYAISPYREASSPPTPCIANKKARFVTQELGGDYLFGLKGNQSGILERAGKTLPQCFFSPEYDTGWVKDHGRLERRRLQRVALSPEKAALCGCWQFIAVWRQREELRQGKVTNKEEDYQFYCTSLAHAEHTAQELVEIIRGHWSACEIGSHYRRDVTLGEDASRIRKAAQPMATLRNLVLGLFELQKDWEQTNSQHVPSWQRKMTASLAIQLIKGGL